MQLVRAIDEYGPWCLYDLTFCPRKSSQMSRQFQKQNSVHTTQISIYPPIRNIRRALL